MNLSCNKKTIIIFLFGIILLAVFYYFLPQSKKMALPTISGIVNPVGLKILNPHSAPKAGSGWGVSFETKGRADLLFTPGDKNTINDVIFSYLSCGEERRAPKILADKSVLFAGWECSAEGKFSNIVSVAGKHNFKIQFGDKTEYAFNSTGANWVSGYSYRKAINIDNTANASALSDYQVKVTNPIYDETGLVGSWHLDGATSGSIANGATAGFEDTSGNSNNGTANNANGTGMAWATGKAGGAVVFDGVDDIVTVADSTAWNFGSGDYAIAFWMKTEQTSDTREYLFKIGTNTLVSVSLTIGSSTATEWTTGGNTIGVHLNYNAGWGSQFASSTNIADNNWHYVVIVREGSNNKLYVDNSVHNSATYSFNALNYPILIGGQLAGSRVFNGTIDEVRIYNRSLSADEIKAQYDAKAKLNYGDVRFTDSDGTTELATAGQGNYWMEKDGTFWVKVPSILANSNKTIYMYYGKSDASQIYNGANTFDFFDDFSGDLSKWNYLGATISGGRLYLPTGTTNYAIHKTAVNRPSIITFNAEATEATAGRVTHMALSSYTNSAIQWGSGRYIGWFEENGGSLLEKTGYRDSTTEASGNNNAKNTVRSNYKLVWGSTESTTQFYRDGTTQNKPASSFPSESTLYFGVSSNGGLANDPIYLENLYVRKYTSPEPTTTSYAEQENLLFNYQKSITLNPVTPSANYQIKVTVGYTTGGDFNLGGNAKTDFSDIRFGDSNGNTYYSYWRESYTASSTATFWVKVPTASTSMIYIYYGNSVAASASNGTNTFEFFDDFSGDLSKWSLTANWQIVNGQLKQTSSDDETALAIYTAPNDFIMEGLVTTPTTGSQYLNLVGRNSPSADFGLSKTYGGTTEGWNIYTGSGWANTPATILANTSYAIKGVFSGTNLYLYGDANVNSATTLRVSATISQTGTNIGLHFANLQNQLADNIRVRKYAATEPAVTASGTQTAWGIKANNYQYRRRIVVTNNVASALYDYQINIATTLDTAALITAGKVNADCSDLRFSSADNFNEESWDVSYPYWIESGCNTFATKIWIKMDTLAASASKTVYMYYGNAGASSATSGANTFIFFDDFNDISSYSQNNAGAFTTVNGIVTQGTTALSWLYKAYTYPATPYITEMRVKPAASGADRPAQWAFDATGTRTQGGIGGWSNTYALYNAPTLSTSGNSGTSLTQIWRTIKLEVSNSNVKIYDDNSLMLIATALATTPIHIGVVSDIVAGAQFDWNRVRKYASPEPTMSGGTLEETSRTSIPPGIGTSGGGFMMF